MYEFNNIYIYRETNTTNIIKYKNSKNILKLNSCYLKTVANDLKILAYLIQIMALPDGSVP